MPRTDYENMSDEELMNAPPPPIPSLEERTSDDDNTPDVIEPGTANASSEAPVVADPAPNEPETPEGDDDEGDEGQTQEGGEGSGADLLGASDDDLESIAKALRDKKQPEGPADGKPKPPEGTQPKPEGDKPTTPETPPASISAEDAAKYKAVHDAIMAPIKANGKDIQLKSVDEAVQLIQMGANYTKKLQELKPHLRLVRMLQDNNLLDETKLSYLIDLDKKDPEAVKKLLKEGNIDPMDVDTSVDHDYKPKSYAPSEAQMTFEETLSEVASSDDGKKVIVTINKEWDKASKEAISREPQLLRVITAQKKSGLYDLISAEVDRQKVLGNFRDVPYINAYYDVGMQLQAQGVIPSAPTTQQQATPAQAPVAPVVQPQQERPVIATRVATPKPAATNSEAARAAAPNRTNPSKEVKPDFNPLAMSDEEFAKVDRLGRRL